MINPTEPGHDPVAPRPAHSGGTSVPPLQHRSLQPASEADMTLRMRSRRRLRLLNLVRRQATEAMARAIPPAPDPIAP